MQRTWARLSPHAGVAFRLPDDAAVRPFHPHRRLLIALAFTTALVLLLGPRLPAAMEFVKDEVAYTPYLVLLVGLWAAFGAVAVFGWVIVRSALPSAARAPGAAPGLVLVPALLLWLVVLTGLALLPGWVGLALVLGLGAAAGGPALRPPPGSYHLWRFDADGGVRACPIHAYLVGTWLVTLLGVGCVVAIAAGPRLTSALDPGGAFGLTQGLGLTATASALILVTRAGWLLRRLVPRPAAAPEQALVPTVWWAEGEVPSSFRAVAEASGFTVAEGEAPGGDGYDLVVGRPADPARFVPRPGAPAADQAFHLRRRFHIRHRRVFFRRFRRLHKEVTALPSLDGAGFLFCPTPGR